MEGVADLACKSKQEKTPDLVRILLYKIDFLFSWRIKLLDTFGNSRKNKNWSFR